jgi:hypothetical protein
MSITYGFFNVKRAMQLLALIIIAATVLAAAPDARAFYTFQVTYSNRTATSAKINWTMRAQEDAPTRASDVARICWAPGSSSNPCASHDVIISQSGAVGQWNSYTITGLNCSTSYTVAVAQSYIAATPSTFNTGDWHSPPAITVPANGAC